MLNLFGYNKQQLAELSDNDRRFVLHQQRIHIEYRDALVNYIGHLSQALGMKYSAGNVEQGKHIVASYTAGATVVDAAAEAKALAMEQPNGSHPKFDRLATGSFTHRSHTHSVEYFDMQLWFST